MTPQQLQQAHTHLHDGPTSTIPTHLLQQLLEQADNTITITDNNNNIIATIEGEQAEHVQQIAISDYIHNLLTNLLPKTPKEKLEHIAQTGHGTLTAAQASRLLHHINDIETALDIAQKANQHLRNKQPTQTITMGGQPHHIYQTEKTP